MSGVNKLKFEFSYTRIVFLDLEIFIEDGKLKTDLHTKPTNKQLYLDFNSNHPDHCKRSIPYSQALRVIERCSNTTDRDGQLTNLKDKFQQRNYPNDLIDSQFERAKKKERQAGLSRATLEISSEFSSEFSSNSPLRTYKSSLHLRSSPI